MNRQTKRQMARQGADKPRAPERRAPATGAPARERVTPRGYLREVAGEMRKVAWPTRSEIINSSIIVTVGIIVMAALIFAFDWISLSSVDFIFG
jgi:preprotein translocase subunit SecE